MLLTSLISSSAHAGFVLHGPPATRPHYLAPDGTFIYPVWDAQGRIVSASGTDAYGVARTLSVDWANMTVAISESGAPTLYNKLTVSGDHILLHYWSSNGVDMYYDIDCTYGADAVDGFVQRFWIYVNGAPWKMSYLPQKSNVAALPKFVHLVTEEAFGYHIDERSAYFKPLYDAVLHDRTQALLQQAGGDPTVASGLAVQNLRDAFGVLGRGVIWGLGGLGGALVVAGATATPIGWAAGAAVFLFGFDASAWSDVFSMYVQPAPAAQTLG
ncbi:MAG: hypothetical protein ACXVDD_30020, partial [Polyangia bacterium]